MPISDYLKTEPRTITVPEITAMSDDEFETLITSTDAQPLLITMVDPDTGKDMSAYIIPLDVMNSVLEEIGEKG